MSRPPGPWKTDGTPLARLRLTRQARKSGARLRTPFRLAAAPGTHPQAQISFGDGVWIGRDAWFTLGNSGARLSIGAGTSIAPQVQISCNQEITIGSGCLIGERFTIVDNDHDWESWIVPAARGEIPPHFTWKMVDPTPTHVGSGCYIGRDVVVRAGVTIGDGCVIGALSAVTRDIPQYSVAVGAPARVVRTVTAEDRP